jgi:hypothetical protein
VPGERLPERQLQRVDRQSINIKMNRNNFDGERLPARQPRRAGDDRDDVSKRFKQLIETDGSDRKRLLQDLLRRVQTYDGLAGALTTTYWKRRPSIAHACAGVNSFSMGAKEREGERVTRSLSSVRESTYLELAVGVQTHQRIRCHRRDRRCRGGSSLPRASGGCGGERVRRGGAGLHGNRC